MTTKLEQFNKVAKERGGKSLATKYINCNTKYEWECAKGHRWFAIWGNVRQKTWCPHCYKTQRTFKEFQEYARKKGGRCLNVIKGSGVGGRYLWECEKGHQWKTKASNIVGKSQTWCPTCRSGKLTIHDCISEANKRGGECLDTEYKNKRTIMTWKCANGHQFRLRLGAVRNNNRWCRKCANDRRRLGISAAHQLAAKNGGECLSIEYTNLETPLQWRCFRNHEWSVALLNIKSSGRWCRKCMLMERSDRAWNRLKEQLHDVTNFHGGKCITDIDTLPYGTHMKDVTLMWECAKGHKFKATKEYIQSETFKCGECYFVEKLKRIQKDASKRGGRLVTDIHSIKYGVDYNDINLAFECYKHHQWTRTLNSTLTYLSWCPYCLYKSEQCCREIFEEIFESPFPKKRLKIMEYLELDGYSELFGLAFEYDGRQHCTYVPHFHRNGPEDFVKQLERDKRKDKLCDANGIALIRIPCRYDYTQRDTIKVWIQSCLSSKGM